MQEFRARLPPRPPPRRHPRVHFNLGRIQPEHLHPPLRPVPEDPTRDAIMKQIVDRINAAEKELSCNKSETKEKVTMKPDSITDARIEHEKQVLNDLERYFESVENNRPDKSYWEGRAGQLQRDLNNWIERNETELEEIDLLEKKVLERRQELISQMAIVERMFGEIKSLPDDDLDHDSDLETAIETLDICSTQSSVPS
ncbi:unnamed protein product, partial [Gongylonema pulchrum]|uniref:Not3 domain-containing protein n=1 Tax=Gongylonema pulchrum TaxID=637853 RepID=A0A183EFK9_9BILA